MKLYFFASRAYCFGNMFLSSSPVIIAPLMFLDLKMESSFCGDIARASR